MPNPKLPVIYAVIEDGTNSLVTACESNKDAELNASAQHRMSETREYSVIAYQPPPETPPREYWRLLEPGEMAQPGDECIRLIRYELRWKPIENCMIGKEVAHVRRRVSPPPTCATCATCEYFDPGLHYFETVCGHHAGLKSPKIDGTSSCSYAEPRESEGENG